MSPGSQPCRAVEQRQAGQRLLQPSSPPTTGPALGTSHKGGAGGDAEGGSSPGNGDPSDLAAPDGNVSTRAEGKARPGPSVLPPSPLLAYENANAQKAPKFPWAPEP